MQKKTVLKLLQRNNPWIIWKRGVVEGRKGAVLGAYEKCPEEGFKLTPHGEKFDALTKGKLVELMKDLDIKFGKTVVLHGLGDYYSVVVAGLGSETLGYNETETLYENRENIRWATALGIKMQQKQDVSVVMVDPMGCAEAAAEGSKLANWTYQEFRDPENRTPNPNVELLCGSEGENEGWFRGSVMADAQNVARTLEDIPANILTPKHFAEEAIRILCPCGIHVNVRHMKWIEDQRMFAFLNIAKGSCEPPFFLEINYCGGAETDRPVLLIGKGVTFDSGGLCLKSCIPSTGHYALNMADYRGAMNGAAVVVGTMKALARLGIPINVVGLIPLFENMPSGSSIKPGDVVLSLKGKTVVVEDTDNEGRLALADALAYSEHFQPCLDVTVGNLAPGTKFSLGSGATGVFSTSQVVWEEMRKAGSITGDRVWRFPLWKQYVRRCTMCQHVDICNLGKGGPIANTCLAAAFLSEFVPDCDFVHMDTTGTGLVSRGVYAPYLSSGFMTGRPVRTLIQFLVNMACPLDASTKCGGQ